MERKKERGRAVSVVFCGWNCVFIGGMGRGGGIWVVG